MATKCHNSTSNSHSRSTERYLQELIKEARWGKPASAQTTPPQCPKNTNVPILIQRSISELPSKDWREREVLEATCGINESELPSYSDKIAKMMSIEDPEIRKNGLTDDELWRRAAHVARYERYIKKGRPPRLEDIIVLKRLGILGGKRKTKRKKTRKYRKTRKSRKAKKSRKTRKSRKAKKSRKTRKSRRSNRRKTHKNNKKHKKK